eukprot:1883634-Amphidinium_carterae.1
MLPHSSCPALLGLESLVKLGAVLDCRQKRLYVAPDEDIEVRLPPGAHCFTLQQAASGHLLLPATLYASAQRQHAAGATPNISRSLAVVPGEGPANE